LPIAAIVKTPFLPQPIHESLNLIRKNPEAHLPSFVLRREAAPGNKVIEFYPINNFITLRFTPTIFTRGLDLYFY
jgi:hypothetical protein